MGMYGGGGAPSLADIAAVTRNNNNGDNDGFGGNNGWWILIILFAIFGGWGNNGYGNNNGGGEKETTIINMPPTGYSAYGGGYGMNGFGLTEAALQRGFDTQTIINKLDGLNSGVCSLGYDQLAQMNGINANIMQTGFGLQQSINQLGVSNMQDTFGLQQAINADTVAGMNNANALSRQLSEYCCENRQGQADIKYTMATDTCAITTAIRQAAQDIMNNDNNNYRHLHDENVQLQMQNYKDTIAQQQQTIMMQNLAQSQANQNTFIQGQMQQLKDDLSPCPVPAYWVQNPNCCQSPWGPFNTNALNNFNNCNGNNWNGSCCG